MNDMHQCSICGLHYEDMDLAAACEKFCNENKACSLEIARQSVEAKEARR